MAVDVTTYDAALKNTYGGIPSQELNNATPLWDRVKRTSKGFDGRQFILALHGRRNQQIGAQPLTGASLPTAASQEQEGYDNATYKPTQLLGVIKLEGAAIELTRTNEGAFVRALRSEVESMAENFAVDFDRQIFGDGTGSLTACGTTTASTTVVVTSTSKLFAGMGIDVVVSATGATGTGATGRTVSSVTDSTHFVISGAAITTDSTYAVYRAGSRTNEVNGLQLIVKATGTLGGLDPTVAGNEYWVAATVDSTTTTPSEIAMQKVYEAPQEQKFGGGGKAKLLLGTFGARRTYQNQLAGLKRYASNPMRLVGGFDALDFNGLPFFADRQCPANSIYFLDTDRLFFLQTRAPHWDDTTGTILKWVTDKPAFKGYYTWFVQFATDARNAHASMTNITES